MVAFGRIVWSSRGYFVRTSDCHLRWGNDFMTIYLGHSESLVGSSIDQFQKDTGVDAMVTYSKTPHLAATLPGEDPDTPGRAMLFSPRTKAVCRRFKACYAPLRLRLMQKYPNGRWIGLSGRTRTVLYNSERLALEELPVNLSGSAYAEWKGLIGWILTNESLQAMVTAMQPIRGEGQTPPWLMDIQVDDPTVYPKITPPMTAAAAWEVDVGFVNLYYLHLFAAEESESSGSITHHLRAVHEFIRYRLSQKSQEYFPGKARKYPLPAGVPAIGEVVPLGQINNPNLPSLDLPDLARSRELIRQAGLIP